MRPDRSHGAVRGRGGIRRNQSQRRLTTTLNRQQSVESWCSFGMTTTAHLSVGKAQLEVLLYTWQKRKHSKDLR